MSSISLPSQAFRPAPPRAAGAAARGLAIALDGLMARLRKMRRDAEANALRERALTYMEINPGFAAELKAAADGLAKLA